MMAEHGPGTRAPTPTQRRLVQAAALDAPDALAAWEAWQRETTVTALEPDSQWLLPALYTNLQRLGVAGARLGRYAQVYRHNWYKNHLLLGAARPLLAALAAAGAAPVLLGGAALAASQYPAAGARPIETLDLWAPTLEAAALPALAAGAGWRLIGANPAGTAWELVDALGRRCRVRWRMLGVEQEARLRAHTRLARVAGQAWRVLGAMDQLIHVLAERSQWDGRSALLWAVDAADCLRRLGPNDRAELAARARALGWAEAAHGGLTLLADGFGLGSLAGEWGDL